MRDISPWVVRRKPGSRRKYQVISMDDPNVDLVIAGEFDSVETAQEFASEANAMWNATKTSGKITASV